MINTHEIIQEVYLQPGQWYFGGGRTRIRTVLGSCVSITLWHPTLYIGGICHYMLVDRGQIRSGAVLGLDGRYADEVIDLLVNQLRRHKTNPSDYQVKLFGGGNMFESLGRKGQATNVAERNVKAGRKLLHSHGFKTVAEHVGGFGHRQVIFELWSGDVWVKHVGTNAVGAGRRQDGLS